MPTRLALPQNYIKSAGTLYESFENTSAWTKSGTDPLGTVTADTDHVRLGSAALRLTVNTAGSNVSATKLINHTFTSGTLFHLWVYVPDILPSDVIWTLEITLTSYSNYSKYFRKLVQQGETKTFVTGWNHLVFHSSEFTNTGGESWERPMVKMTFRIYYLPGQKGYVTLDNMFYAQESIPRCVITFDDTFDTIYSVAFAKMNPLGLRGTVYITKNIIESGIGICGAALTKDHIHEMYEAGWAVCPHTVSHPDLSTLTQTQIEDELMGCYDWLLENGWSRTAKHVAYPYGSKVTEAMVAAMESTGMVTGRTTFVELESVPFGSIYHLKSKCIGEGTVAPISLQTAKGWVDAAIRNQVTLDIFGHSLADGHENDANFWGATKFNSLIDYIVARRLKCATIDEWYVGLTNPRYRSLPLPIAQR